MSTSKQQVDPANFTDGHVSVSSYGIIPKLSAPSSCQASSSSRNWVVGHLSQLGLLSYFDYIRCGDEVARKKPDPELYLAVLAALHIQAEQAIVLEDSPNGILAARRAGIFCVAVPNPLTSQLPLDHANLRLASLADMSLERLIEEVQK